MTGSWHARRSVVRRGVCHGGRGALLALFVSGCAGLPEPARPAPRLEPGQRIRVKIPSASPPRQAGTLVALTSDSIVLRAAAAGPAGTDATRLAFPLAAVKTVEKSLGVRGHALDGAVYGGQVGLIVVLLGFAAGQWVPGDPQSIAVFGGSTIGGALIGAAIRTESWRKVPLSSVRAGLTVLPAGRLAVGATFTLQR